MAFKTNNLHYAFMVEYFTCNPDEANDNLIMIGSDASACYSNKSQSFRLQTTYPGMLAGLGIVHGSNELGGISAGLSFDYVTGAPYIPGSSVKGILHHAFERPDYIKLLLDREDIDAGELEREIFEGSNAKHVLDRDVFYDAFPITKGRIIDIDVTAAHGDEMLAPNVSMYAKVSPNVVFEFSFKLNDGIITADEKLKLFKEILKDMGVGSRTNVGYGCLVDVDENNAFAERSLSYNTKINCRNCGKLYTLSDFEEKMRREKGWKTIYCTECQVEIRRRKSLMNNEVSDNNE